MLIVTCTHHNDKKNMRVNLICTGASSAPTMLSDLLGRYFSFCLGNIMGIGSVRLAQLIFALKNH